MDLPVLGKWNGRTPVRLSGEWRVPPGPRADRSPAAAQAGSWLPGKEFSRKGPGVRQAAAECGPAACSCGERRQLHGDPVGGTAGQQAGGRGSLLWGIWETASGDLCLALSCTVQGRHCCTGAGWLEVQQGNEGVGMQDVSRKTGTETRRNVSFSAKRRESLWEMVMLSSIT